MNFYIIIYLELPGILYTLRQHFYSLKQLIADTYKALYKLTGKQLFSLAIALSYITLLNLVTLYGLCILFKGLFTIAGLLTKLFVFPYYFLTAIVMLVINFSLTLPLEKLLNEKRRKPAMLTLIIYSLAALVLFLYTHYSEMIFRAI
jgi:hypothetical protein